MEYEKGCQGRKFVLGFVIKSQKKGRKEKLCRIMPFLDKRAGMLYLAVNGILQAKEVNYLQNRKNKRTIIRKNIKLYLLFRRFCAIIYSRGRREKELLHFCKAEPITEKRSWYL